MLKKSTLIPQSFKARLAGGAVNMRAYLEVPESGEYTFWVRAKDSVDFSMNRTGLDPAGAVRLLEGVKKGDGKTESIHLTKGKQYYIELYGANGGEMAVGWSRDAKAENPDEIIPAEYLIPVGRPRSILPIDDVVQATAETPLIIDAMANDKDYRFADPSNHECLHIHYVGQTENGKTERVNNNQQIKYTPNPGFKGTDKFQYGIQSKTYRDRMQVGSITVTVK